MRTTRLFAVLLFVALMFFLGDYLGGNVVVRPEIPHDVSSLHQGVAVGTGFVARPLRNYLVHACFARREGREVQSELLALGTSSGAL